MDPDVRNQVVQAARSILDGESPLLPAVRRLADLLNAAEDLGLGDAQDTIIGIDSELDDLPIGRERELWAPEALVQKQAQIDRCIELYREPALNACRQIVARIGHTV